MKMYVKNSVKGVVLAVSILNANSAVFAASDEGLFATRGTGGLQCSEYVNRLQGERGLQVRNELSLWLAGYLTHANRNEAGFYDVSPVNSNAALAVIVGRVCRTNPDVLVETAVVSILDSMVSLAPRSETPASIVRNEDFSVEIYEDVMLRFQMKLVGKGFLEEDSADGKYGPKTRKAITEYQEERSLRQTGIPDPLTLLDISLPTE